MRRSLVYWIDPTTTLTLGSDVVATLHRHAQHRAEDLEAGGLLVGRQLREGGHLVVDLVTEPGPDDVRERFGFRRATEPHQSLLQKAWEASNGTAGIIGTWHTHAEPYPRPSRIDIDNWRDHARLWTYDIEALTHIIVGTEDTGAWEVDRQGRFRVLLPRESYPGHG